MKIFVTIGLVVALVDVFLIFEPPIMRSYWLWKHQRQYEQELAEWMAEHHATPRQVLESMRGH